MVNHWTNYPNLNILGDNLSLDRAIEIVPPDIIKLITSQNIYLSEVSQ